MGGNHDWAPQGATAKRSWTHALTRLGMGAVLVGGLGALGAGCITRPVASQSPTTKTNFTSVVRQAAVDKVDILFAIDNSASMGPNSRAAEVALASTWSRCGFDQPVTSSPR